jgi:hypothetical protein
VTRQDGYCPSPTPFRHRPRRWETLFRHQLPAPRQLAARRPRPRPLRGAHGRTLLYYSRPTPAHYVSVAGRPGTLSVTNSLTPQTSALGDFVPTPAARPTAAGRSETSSETTPRCPRTHVAILLSPDTSSLCLGGREAGYSLCHQLPYAADLGAGRLCSDTSCPPHGSWPLGDLVRDHSEVPTDARCYTTLARHQLTMSRWPGGRVLSLSPTPFRHRPRRWETLFRHQLPAPRQLAARRPRPRPLRGAHGRTLLYYSRPTPAHYVSVAGRSGTLSVTNSLTPQTSALGDFVPTPAARPTAAGRSETSSETTPRCPRTHVALLLSSDTSSLCLGGREAGYSLRHPLPSAADLGAGRLRSDTSCPPHGSWPLGDLVRDHSEVPTDARCYTTLARHQLTMSRWPGGRVLSLSPTPLRRRPRRWETLFRHQLPAPRQLAALRPRPRPLRGAHGRTLLYYSRPTPARYVSAAGRPGTLSVTHSRPPQTSALGDCSDTSCPPHGSCPLGDLVRDHSSVPSDARYSVPLIISDGKRDIPSQPYKMQG